MSCTALFNITDFSCSLIECEDLCILNDKLVWILYCDVVCLNYDGNVLDASVIALSAALRNVKLPTVSVDPDSNLPSTDFENVRSLKLSCSPSPITFTVFEGKIIIADPTAKEEEVTSGSFTIIANEENKIIYLERSGGVALSEEDIQNCIKKAIKLGSHIRKLYKTVCETNE